jgi:hypothetical protein
MKRLTLALLLVIVVLIPATAFAVTIPEIVSLAQAGVSDEVIIALIDRDNGVFSMDAAQLQELNAAGVSPAVVLAMLKSGMQTPAPAENVVMPGPQIVIVGHGPDVPNTTAADLDGVPIRFVVPYVAGSVAGHGACTGTVERHDVAAANTHPVSVAPFGRFMNDPTARFINNGFVTNNGLVTSNRPAIVPDCQVAPSEQQRERSGPRH